MRLLDARETGPTLIERVTLRGLVAVCAYGFSLCLIFDLLWGFGWAIFSHAPGSSWFYPIEMLLTASWLVCGLGLLVAVIAESMQDRAEKGR